MCGELQISLWGCILKKWGSQQFWDLIPFSLVFPSSVTLGESLNFFLHSGYFDTHMTIPLF